MTIVSEATALLVPAALHGAAKQAAAVSRRAVTSLTRGGAWPDCFEPTVDVATLPGFILLNGPSSLFGGEPHLHVYSPMRELDRAVDAGRLDLPAALPAFEASLGRPWALLGLLSQANYRWMDDSARRRAFLRSMAAAWPLFEAAGDRFTMGSRTGQGLWSLPTLLKYALAQEGVAAPRLTAPLPAGGLGALLAWSGRC